uniref:Uncharacterized protein n=1 Tax=Physcomitrium patens TaxID=3218 RepID=A0A7I4ECI8_PHYPA
MRGFHRSSLAQSADKEAELPPGILQFDQYRINVVGSYLVPNRFSRPLGKKDTKIFHREWHLMDYS